MNEKKRFNTDSDDMITIIKYIGGGGQGKVYRSERNGREFALKVYSEEYIGRDSGLKKRIENLIDNGSPGDRFIWPLELISFNSGKSIGYTMELLESRFRPMTELMNGKILIDFRSLIKIGYELADSFLQLHSFGLCYRDISFFNIFLDPESGDIRIIDTDNIDINKRKGFISGTPRFIAPEIITGKADPSTETDLFSFSVLLFYLLMMHHPLEGRNEVGINCLDLPAMNKLYGTDPVFIFDPDNFTNRPVKGEQDNPLIYWKIYPEFIKRLFTKSFTSGLFDPENGRVRESEWRKALNVLGNSISYCKKCGMENFYDFETGTMCNEGSCWHCKSILINPFKLKVGKFFIVLNSDTKIFSDLFEPGSIIGRKKKIAVVVPHPSKAGQWGIKNVSESKWKAVVNGKYKDVITIAPGKSISLKNNLKIDFGGFTGIIYI